MNVLDRIVYCDHSLVVVDKPTGLLSVPGRTEDKQDCVLRRLRNDFGELKVVHRLDRDTSGLLAFARDDQTQRELNRHFATGMVRKDYIACVEGLIHASKGQIDLAIRRDMDISLPPRYLVDPVHGKPATTRWRVLARCGNQTRLRLRPVTGRSHQLRVHCAAIGHPIVGDPIYGEPAERLKLHAYRLVLPARIDAPAIRLHAPVPF